MRKEDTARRVVTNRPPCLGIKEGGQYYAVVIGETETAKAIIRALITMGQLERTSFRIDWITQSVGKKESRIDFGECPFLAIQIKVLPLLQSPEVLCRYLKQHEDAIHQIYVCTENREYDNELEHMIKTEVLQEAGQISMEVVNVSGDLWLKNGLLIDCSDDIIERMGKEIFRDYERTHESNRRWEELTAFEQDANYNSAMHIPVKLFLVGLRIQKEEDQANGMENEEEFLRFLTERMIQKLSRLEHLRWCAFYMVSGYHPLPIEEAKGLLHDKISHRHGCLVPWEELPTVSKHYGHDFQKEDRDRVVNIFHYVEQCGHQIVKITPELLPECLIRKEVSVYPRK